MWGDFDGYNHIAFQMKMVQRTQNCIATKPIQSYTFVSYHASVVHQLPACYAQSTAASTHLSIQTPSATIGHRYPALSSDGLCYIIRHA